MLFVDIFVAEYNKDPSHILRERVGRSNCQTRKSNIKCTTHCVLQGFSYGHFDKDGAKCVCVKKAVTRIIDMKVTVPTTIPPPWLRITSPQTDYSSEEEIEEMKELKLTDVDYTDSNEKNKPPNYFEDFDSEDFDFEGFDTDQSDNKDNDHKHNKNVCDCKSKDIIAQNIIDNGNIKSEKKRKIKRKIRESKGRMRTPPPRLIFINNKDPIYPNYD